VDRIVPVHSLKGLVAASLGPRGAQGDEEQVARRAEDLDIGVGILVVENDLFEVG
jgi:hypothetical protein